MANETIERNKITSCAGTWLKNFTNRFISEKKKTAISMYNIPGDKTIFQLKLQVVQYDFYNAQKQEIQNKWGHRESGQNAPSRHLQLKA